VNTVMNLRVLASLYYLIYRVTRVKRIPCLGGEIFNIEYKHMRDICFLKFGNILKTGNYLNILS
jgi:hypothetical protein